MSHTTNVYYKDRLGFEPEYESRLAQSSSQQQTSVTKSTLYSSGLTASSSSAIRSSSQSQTKATVHHQSTSHSSTSNNHYSSSRDQHQAITTGNSHHSSAALDSTQHNVSAHGVYEENLTKFKGPGTSIIINLFLMAVCQGIFSDSSTVMSQLFLEKRSESIFI